MDFTIMIIWLWLNTEPLTCFCGEWDLNRECLVQLVSCWAFTLRMISRSLIKSEATGNYCRVWPSLNTILETSLLMSIVRKYIEMIPHHSKRAGNVNAFVDFVTNEWNIIKQRLFDFISKGSIIQNNGT